MTAQAGTVQELIGSFREHGDKPAIIIFGKDSARELSYREMADAIASLAGGISQQMEHAGRVFGLCAGNSPRWVITALAVIRAGGIILPIDQQADAETLRHIIRDSGAGLVFTSRELAGKIRELALPHQPRLVLLDSEEGEQSWSALLADQPGQPQPADPDDTAALFYTSGTTGAPKGVPLSHANLASQPAAILETGLLTPDDRALLPLPLHHVYPFVIGMLTPLAAGLPLVFPESLTGREIVRALVEGRVTIIIGVPRLYRTLYDGIRSRVAAHGRTAHSIFSALLGLSGLLRRRFGIVAGRRLFPMVHRQFGVSLRILASGGSQLDAGLARQLEGLGWQVAIGYGLTETAPLLTINLPGSGRLESVGRPVKDVEIRIDGDAPGEVLARGPNVFHGYHQLRQATTESFTADGWFRTGDLGRLDREGYLYLQGRAKTLIVTESGENLQPDEIEEFYATHSAIGEIGVFLHQNRLTGIIVPDLKQIRQAGDNLEEIIRKAVAEQSAKLPSFKRLEEYVISREALARTRLGKVRRHLLAERFQQARAGEDDTARQRGPIPFSEMSDRDQALLEEANAARIWEWLARRFPDRRLTPDSSPRFDLGIDSLEWLDVSLEVQQRTGVELSEEAIGRINTLRDLLAEVSSSSESAESMDPETPLQEPESVLDADQKRWLEPLGPLLSLLSFTTYLLNRALMRVCFRLEVIGRDNLPEERQYIITPNHLSLLDPLAVAAALPYPVLRRTFMAGWTGIAYRNVVFRFVSRLARAVPIDSRHAIASSLAFGSAVLGRGRSLLWFPEGGISRSGRLQEFKPGISLLLEHHDLPVVPAFIHGTNEALPRHKTLPRFRKITLIIGRPVTRDELAQGQTGDSVRDQVRHGLHDAVARLQPDQERRNENI